MTKPAETAKQTWRPAIAASALLLVLVLSVTLALAQEGKDNEVGFVFSATGFQEDGEAGVGARFLRNYTPGFGFELQGTFYPADESVSFYQGSFNFKGTYRMEQLRRVNFFGVAGPGFLVVKPASSARTGRFALNVGGGIEIVPQPHVAVRADVSDFVFFVDGDPFNNFDFKLALMYRW